jgi:hypothetical protein
LREQGVFVSRRGSSIRFAPHLHVTEADLAQLAAALKRLPISPAAYALMVALSPISTAAILICRTISTL